MAIIPKPTFPNVPRLPGVPQLVRSAQFPPAPAPILGAVIALGRLFTAFFAQPVWGVFKSPQPTTTTNEDGIPTVTVTAERAPVVVPDSFLEFGYRAESNVSDYPVEMGSFTSYDKVANPFEVVVRLTKGGSLTQRTRFVDALMAIEGTTDLYDIITPEKTYLFVNVTRVEIARRGAKNAFFLSEVDVFFREIRQVESVYTTSSTSPESVITAARNAEANVVQNIGTVQAQLETKLTPEALGIPVPSI